MVPGEVKVATSVTPNIRSDEDSSMGDDQVMVKRAAALELGGRFKTEGNGYFKQKHMLAAIDSYSKAIKALREYPLIDDAECDAEIKEIASILYANRAAAALGYGGDHAARAELFFNLGVADDFVGQSVWEAEVLRQLDSAEKDARVAITFNDKNAKAHFRLGTALLDLAEKDRDVVDKMDKLKAACNAFGRANELQPEARTKAKEDYLRKLIAEEEAMAKVKPVGST